MLAKHVELHKSYIVLVSGAMTVVKLTHVSPHGGWWGRNLKSNRQVRFKNAGRLRRLATPSEIDHALTR